MVLEARDLDKELHMFEAVSLHWSEATSFMFTAYSSAMGKGGKGRKIAILWERWLLEVFEAKEVSNYETIYIADVRWK